VSSSYKITIVDLGGYANNRFFGEKRESLEKIEILGGTEKV